MKKYNFEALLKKLNANEFNQAMEEIPEVLGMKKKHFKYTVLPAKIEGGVSLRIDQLLNFKNYLIQKYPRKFRRLTLDQLVNEKE